jgi:apolipoprotein N-acyltransferase
VRAQLGVFREGVISARVLGLRDLTFYSRWPWLVPFLSTVVSVVFLGLSLPFAVYFARRSPS